MADTKDATDNPALVDFRDNMAARFPVKFTVGYITSLPVLEHSNMQNRIEIVPSKCIFFITIFINEYKSRNYTVPVPYEAVKFLTKQKPLLTCLLL